ncbi:MAG: hypothetical protein IPM74_12735 [Crocinitomicaceae bacterium]|nr:hypothetical protein [Crocinitomicaceae bacterium]MBK8926741.1 hypothetical protein [Crocinitomicaceae bacterium]
MSKIKSFPEGLTYEYLVHGVFTFILGGFLLFFSAFISLPVMAVGIGMIVISTGVDVDNNENKLRKYKSVFGYKWGNWINISHIKKIELIYDFNTGKLPGVLQGNVYPTPIGAPNRGGTLKTFDLYLTYQNNERILLNKFNKAGLALGVMKELQKFSFLEIDNQYEKMLVESFKGRRY